MTSKHKDRKRWFNEVLQGFLNNSVLKLVHMNRRRTDILDVGEPIFRRRRTNGRRNGGLPDNQVNSFMLPFRLKMHKGMISLLMS